MAPSRDTNPSAYQDVFVDELRARREASNLSRNKLAAALGCTPQWIAKVETFEKPPSEGLADDLDTYFKTGGTFRRVWTKHTEARKRGLIPKGIRPLVDAEKDATRIGIYEPLLITGLLQTEEYARFVLQSGTRAHEVEDLVTIRMERQAILNKTVPPWLFVVTRESAIRDIRKEFRAEQCKWLLEVMGYRRVALQIVPTSRDVFQPSGFQMLSFGQAPDVAYVDGAGGHGQILTEPHEVEGLAVLFDVIRTAALSVAESEELIRRIMEDT